MSFAVNTDTGRACLVQLRKGTEDAPLFLFPGLGADSNELAGIASRTHNLKAMIGVDFCRHDNENRFPATVVTMAERSCLAIRVLQPRGPYYLVGYSFGGLVAIEVARLLRASGEEVALLGMIDARYDSRYWPTGLFLRSQARLIGRYLASLRHSPPSAAIRMLFHRTRGFLTRFLRRQMPTSSIPAAKAGAVSVYEHCKTAMSNYRPSYYKGKITLFDAENDGAEPEFGCKPIELWRQIASEIECRTVPGTHLGIVRDDSWSVALPRLSTAALMICLKRRLQIRRSVVRRGCYW